MQNHVLLILTLTFVATGNIIMAPRTIRRRAPRKARVSTTPQQARKRFERIYETITEMERRYCGPRAYTMNAVERFLLPRTEGMGIPPHRTQSLDVLRRYLQMQRRINRNLRESSSYAPGPMLPSTSAESQNSPLPHQHRPRANSAASNEGPAAAPLQDDALVDVCVNSPAVVIPPILVTHEDAELKDLAVNDDAEDIGIDDYAEDLAAIEGARAPPQPGSVSPLLSPIVSSDDAFGHAFMSPEIEHGYYYDCPLCLAVQASPTNSNASLDEFGDYEPNLFR